MELSWRALWGLQWEQGNLWVQTPWHKVSQCERVQLCMGHPSIPDVYGVYIHPRCVILGCRAPTLLGAKEAKGCWRAWPGPEGVGRKAWEELEGEWDPMANGAGAGKDEPLVIQFTRYPPREGGAPKAAPSTAGRCWQQEP